MPLRSVSVRSLVGVLGVLAACGGRESNPGAGAGRTASGSDLASGEAPSGVPAPSGQSSATSSAALSGSDVECVIAAQSYDRSCVVDADCAGVNAGNYCGPPATCPCGPPSTAINVRALAQFNADVAKTPAAISGNCACLKAPSLNDAGSIQPGPCCSNGACQVGGCTETCVATTTRCAANAVETCRTDGEWGAPFPCNGQTCDGGVCSGMCGPDQKRCYGDTAQICNASGQWQGDKECSGSTPLCDNGVCVAEPPSCAPGGPGMTDCGASHESCCTSLEVVGGTYYRSYDPQNADGGIDVRPDGGPTELADPATVSTFRLDKYDVTVGRFRQFVNAWSAGAGWMPTAGSGKHAHLNGGEGLINSGSVGEYEPGWVASDDSNISPTNTPAGLRCEYLDALCGDA